jgi:hypothetical protein
MQCEVRRAAPIYNIFSCGDEAPPLDSNASQICGVNMPKQQRLAVMYMIRPMQLTGSGART